LVARPGSSGTSGEDHGGSGIADVSIGHRKAGVVADRDARSASADAAIGIECRAVATRLAARARAGTCFAAACDDSGTACQSRAIPSGSRSGFSGRRGHLHGCGSGRRPSHVAFQAAGATASTGGDRFTGEQHDGARGRSDRARSDGQVARPTGATARYASPPGGQEPSIQASNEGWSSRLVPVSPEDRSGPSLSASSSDSSVRSFPKNSAIPSLRRFPPPASRYHGFRLAATP